MKLTALLKRYHELLEVSAGLDHTAKVADEEIAHIIETEDLESPKTQAKLAAVRLRLDFIPSRRRQNQLEIEKTLTQLFDQYRADHNRWEQWLKAHYEAEISKAEAAISPFHDNKRELRGKVQMLGLSSLYDIDHDLAGFSPPGIDERKHIGQCAQNLQNMLRRLARKYDWKLE